MAEQRASLLAVLSCVAIPPQSVLVTGAVQPSSPGRRHRPTGHNTTSLRLCPPPPRHETPLQLL